MVNIWFRVHGSWFMAIYDSWFRVHDYFNRAPLTVNREPVIMALAAPKVEKSWEFLGKRVKMLCF
jgi:hypothetical protein